MSFSKILFCFLLTNGLLLDSGDCRRRIRKKRFAVKVYPELEGQNQKDNFRDLQIFEECELTEKHAEWTKHCLSGTPEESTKCEVLTALAFCDEETVMERLEENGDDENASVQSRPKKKKSKKSKKRRKTPKPRKPKTKKLRIGYK